MLTRLAEKQAAVRTQIKDEQEMLERGYNRITEHLLAQTKPEITPESEPELDEDLTETTPFLEALLFARVMIKCSRHTHEDLDSILKYIRIAVLMLGYDRIPVKEVRRRHLITLLNKCGEIKLSWRKHLLAENPGKKIKESWTSATFNKYRTHLSMVYRQLLKMEAVDSNLCEAIDLEKYIKKARKH
ncbi:hypothetical protein [Filimonas effusa]|uniref:Uncharacterized protein n=1 Tax=Filimonas effusa TaxID=2508721 RepID=A0A4Q1D3K9_9BACT|nr:hypothetical protein [Filimonas effusa]RXK82898.1 hypothetical protein ESB13_12275 [Filimonas effusa]